MDHVGRNGLVVACQREKFGACRICDLIDRGGQHYREGYRRLFHPKEFSADEEPVASETHAADPGSMAAETTPNPHAERNLLILGCDYRGPKLGCGCNDKRWCGLRKGPWADDPYAVTYSDCLRCVCEPLDRQSPVTS